ncbi:MAG: hypothetical protein KDB18_12510 [Salinibacterium sp.]|nr:hypothetical protein [Salinibacterium sp.]
MKRRFIGVALCLLLLPVFGAARLLWSSLRAIAWRPRGLLVVGGLGLALSSAESRALLAPNGVGPMGHMIPYLAGAAGLVVLVVGLRSRETRFLWRRLR